MLVWFFFFFKLSSGIKVYKLFSPLPWKLKLGTLQKLTINVPFVYVHQYPDVSQTMCSGFLIIGKSSISNKHSKLHIHVEKQHYSM